MAGSASSSPDVTIADSPAIQHSYRQGQHFGGGGGGRGPHQHRGSHSLDLPPYASVGPSAGNSHGVDLRSSSMDTAMELTRVRAGNCMW